MSYLELQELINRSQHGFLHKRSTLTNLLEYLNFVLKEVDEGKEVDVLYLDMQKAFDKVSHDGLLIKLKEYGITGEVYRWIEGWLMNRRQRVVLNNEVSEWKQVESGVPQGSVLGPLLFIIYIDDVDKGLNNSVLKFADDSKLFGVVGEGAAEGYGLQEDLNKIVQWSKVWMMPLNEEKCHVMHFGKNSDNRINYYVNDKVLKVVDEEKDLGVIIQSDLKVNKQCSTKVATAFRILGMINRTITCKSKDIILKLYKSLVRPHLEYCAQS